MRFTNERLEVDGNQTRIVKTIACEFTYSVPMDVFEGIAPDPGLQRKCWDAMLKAAAVGIQTSCDVWWTVLLEEAKKVLKPGVEQ